MSFESRTRSSASLTGGVDTLKRVKLEGQNKSMEKELQEISLEIARRKKAAEEPIHSYPPPDSQPPIEATPSPATTIPGTGSQLMAVGVDPKKVSKERALRNRLDQIEAEKAALLESLGSAPTPNGNGLLTPPTRVMAATPRTIPSSLHEDSEEEDTPKTLTRDEKGRFVENGKVLSDVAIEQRLRRATTLKKNGTIPLGEEAQRMFQDLQLRPNLIQMFKDTNLNKAELKRVITVSKEKESEKTQTVSSGWYTEAAMKSQLKMEKSEIQDIVKFTAKHKELRRKWKYNTDKFEHWVDINDGAAVNNAERSKQKEEEQELKTAHKPLKHTQFGAPMPPKARGKRDDDDDDDDDAPSPADLEENDPVELISTAMETLLTKSAKMDDIKSKLAGLTCDSSKSLKNTAQKLKDDMDACYDILAVQVAKAKKSKANKLSAEMETQLETAEILGSRCVRVESSATPLIREAKTRQPKLPNSTAPKTAAKKPGKRVDQEGPSKPAKRARTKK